MATYTTNYNLEKPALSDLYDIGVQNTNMDLIDSQMKTNADAISAMEYHVGDSISMTPQLVMWWKTGSQLRMMIPLSKPIGADVNTITQTGNFEFRNYAASAVASGHPISYYGTPTFYKRDGGIAVYISSLNANWTDSASYTSGFAYANAGNTITFS